MKNCKKDRRVEGASFLHLPFPFLREVRYFSFILLYLHHMSSCIWNNASLNYLSGAGTPAAVRCWRCQVPAWTEFTVQWEEKMMNWRGFRRGGAFHMEVREDLRRWCQAELREVRGNEACKPWRRGSSECRGPQQGMFSSFIKDAEHLALVRCGFRPRRSGVGPKTLPS